MRNELKKYTFSVSWSEQDQEFVGLCSGFPSLSHLSVSPQHAFLGIIDLTEDVIIDMLNNNEELP